MFANIWQLLYHESSLPLPFLLISCCLGLFYWKRLTPPLKLIVVYLVFNFFIETAARVTGYLYKQNLPLLHLYTLGEFILFTLFYHKILDSSSLLKRGFRWILLGGSVLVVLNTLFLQNIFSFNSYAKSMVQVMIILYALDYAFRFTQPDRAEPSQNNALQLINAAVLLYYCGSLFVFLTSSFATRMSDAIRILWQINTALNVIFQVIVLIALWKAIFRPQTSSSSPVQAS